MKRPRYGTWLDAILGQLGWWVCVLGAANGLELLGPATVAAMLVVQLAGLPPDVRKRAGRHVIVLGVAGTALDSLHGALGVMRFEGGWAPWLAPLWITALWCQFATALPAFSALRSRPLVAVLIGAIGAPMAYAGGARLGAASLLPEPWISLLVIAAVWAVAFPLMLRFLLSLPEPEPASLPARPPKTRLAEPVLAEAASARTIGR